MRKGLVCSGLVLLLLRADEVGVCRSPLHLCAECRHVTDTPRVRALALDRELSREGLPWDWTFLGSAWRHDPRAPCPPGLRLRHFPALQGGLLCLQCAETTACSSPKHNQNSTVLSRDGLSSLQLSRNVLTPTHWHTLTPPTSVMPPAPFLKLPSTDITPPSVPRDLSARWEQVCQPRPHCCLKRPQCPEDAPSTPRSLFCQTQCTGEAAGVEKNLLELGLWPCRRAWPTTP